MQKSQTLQGARVLVALWTTLAGTAAAAAGTAPEMDQDRQNGVLTGASDLTAEATVTGEVDPTASPGGMFGAPGPAAVARSRGDAETSEPGAIAALPTVGGNVRISADTTIDTVAVDWDAATGNLFAVTRATDRTWKLHMSTDGGASWSEKYSWGSIADFAQISVVGGYVYIGYVASATTYEDLRLRRAPASTGEIDATYGSFDIVDVYPDRVTELVMSSNPEDFDNRVYVAVLLDDGTIRYWWNVASDGKSVTETSPTLGTAADHGLAIDYNRSFPVCGDYMVLSYVGSNDGLYVYLRNECGTWDAGQSVISAPETYTTSLAAYDGVYMVAYEKSDGAAGIDAQYRISYNGGSSWATGTLGDASVAGESFYLPMVSARSRTGLAALQQHEAGALDEFQFRERHNYVNSAWSPTVMLNDYDQSIDVYFQSDFEWMGSGWGMAYRRTNGEAWFGWSRSIRYSGLEVEGLSEWSNY